MNELHEREKKRGKVVHTWEDCKNCDFKRVFQQRKGEREREKVKKTLSTKNNALFGREREEGKAWKRLRSNCYENSKREAIEKL